MSEFRALLMNCVRADHEPFPFERRFMMNPVDSNGTVQSIFVKEPSNVVDAAWAELLECEFGLVMYVSVDVKLILDQIVTSG